MTKHLLICQLQKFNKLLKYQSSNNVKLVCKSIKNKQLPNKQNEPEVSSYL